jgi:hypothetical protein
MGNFPLIQTSWPAYACNFLMPLGWASRELTASRRNESMTSRSWRNMSGCWSYFLEMYWRIDDARESWVDFRNGSDSTWELQHGDSVSPWIALPDAHAKGVWLLT